MTTEKAAIAGKRDHPGVSPQGEGFGTCLYPTARQMGICWFIYNLQFTIYKVELGGVAAG